MPTYDYICRDCGDRFDHFQSMSSPPLTRREGCESKNCNVERVVSGGTGLIFKGSGFYETDYRSESYQKAAKADTSSSSSETSDTKKTSKKADTSGTSKTD